MKTHELYYIDKYGRRKSQFFNEQEYKRELPEILEHGYIMSIEYHVVIAGTDKKLDYYNINR
jgi:hypothetical protein